MKYHHWMRQYIGIYQLAKWLSLYARLFLALGDATKPFDLAPRLVPMEDPVFLPDIAPPLLQLLGHGANFIIRELARAEAVDPDNAFLHRHCYPAYSPVREFLTRAGIARGWVRKSRGRGKAGSRTAQIHRFLVHHLGQSGAHFGHTFDLPLLWAVEVPDVWAEVTGGLPCPIEIDAFHELRHGGRAVTEAGLERGDLVHHPRFGIGSVVLDEGRSAVVGRTGSRGATRPS